MIEASGGWKGGEVLERCSDMTNNRNEYEKRGTGILERHVFKKIKEGGWRIMVRTL